MPSLQHVKFWRVIIFSVVIVWAIAGGAIYWARAARPSAESVIVYLQKHPVASQGASDRAQTMDKVAGMLNRVTFEERQQVQRSGEIRKFFGTLNSAEQSKFLDATLPAGFKQMIEAFNKMTPEKRKNMVDRALTEMRQHEGEGPPPGTDEKITQQLVNEGLRSFYSDASADVKLDLAPLIEQMQHNLQSR